MSFMLTTEQIRNRTKTVTRRLGWKNLKPGTVLNACVKCQGLKKGEKVQKICQIRVTDVRQEELACMSMVPKYGNLEATREGFPKMSGRGFVEMFCKHMGVHPTVQVTRIQFEYIEGES
jgi:hypothetical protein